MGIYICGMKDLDGEQSSQFEPFDDFTMERGSAKLSSIVDAYDPPYSASKQIYDYIKDNLAESIDEVIESLTRSIDAFLASWPEMQAMAKLLQSVMPAKRSAKPRKGLAVKPQ